MEKKRKTYESLEVTPLGIPWSVKPNNLHKYLTE